MDLLKNIYFLILSIIMSCVGSKYDAVNATKERKELRKLQHQESVVRVFDGIPEPRMPDDDLNDETIAGVDSNKDGVRDDVEIWINRRYDDPNLRKANKQFARALTRWMLFSGSSPEIIAKIYTYEYTKAMTCVSRFYGYSSAELEKYGIEYKKVFSFVVGTNRIRRNADSIAENKLVGVSADLYSKDEISCDFKLDEARIKK